MNGAQTQRPGSGPEEIKCLRRLARVRRNAQWGLDEAPQMAHLRDELRQVVAAA